jgi:hypothetical protein
MKKIYLIILFVLLMVFLPFQKAYALSCVEPPPPEIAIHEYDVVVIATVTEVKDTTSRFFGNRYDLGSGALVKANVSLSFKGYDNNTITFNEDLQWGESKVGREYLLFLNKKGDGYVSPLCSPTTETAGLNMDTLVETLSAESTSVIEADQLNESNNSDNSEFSWGLLLLISTIIILIIIGTVIFYRRGKVKQNGGN